MSQLDGLYTFTLKILFRGQEKPAFYDVEEEVFERVCERLEENYEGFFWFSTLKPSLETKTPVVKAPDSAPALHLVCNNEDGYWLKPPPDGRDVLMRIQAVELINFLWTPGPPKLNSTTGEDDNMLIQFENRQEPFRCYPAWPEEVYYLFCSLDDGDFKYDPFISFTDFDGELVALDARKVLHIEAPSRLIDEGRKMAEEELTKTSAAMSARKKTLRTFKRPDRSRRRR